MDTHMNFALIAPELILTAGGIIVMLLSAFIRDARGTVTTALAVGTLSAALALLLLQPLTGEAFSGTYQADAFSTFAKVLIYGASMVALLLTPRFFVSRDVMRGEYPALILFAAVGMGLMVSATDFISLYIGLELNSLASYVLAAFYVRDQRSNEAGLKYFVLGSLASGILLYGMSLLYGFAGTTEFLGVAQAVSEGRNAGILMGIVFVLAGLAFKISAVPFHMWTPDVYEGAPTPVTAFFASAPKVAGMALLARVVIEALGPAKIDWQQIMIFIALASTILGAIAGVRQTNIKRLLAYSSINNVGFALVGLAAGTPDGVAAMLTYLVVYLITTLGAFACVLQMRTRDGRQVEDIRSLAGIAASRPGLAWAFAIFMWSLAGIPPLFGFWPKFLVFMAAVRADITWVAVIAVIASVIGAFYYLRIVKLVFFDKAGENGGYADDSPWIERAVMFVSAMLVSVFGYLAIPALAATSQAAAAALF